MRVFLYVFVFILFSCENSEPNNKIKSSGKSLSSDNFVSINSAKSKHSHKEPVKNTAKKEKPLPKNILRLDKMCSSGNAGSCRVLSIFYLKGISVERNRAKSQKYSSLAKANYMKIIPQWEKKCKSGSPVDCLNIGMAYRDALGVGRDFRQAVTFLKKAADFSSKRCKKNEAEYCYRLGRIYLLGLVPIKSLWKKKKFRKSATKIIIKSLSKACNLRFADACGEMGRLNKKGKLVKRDVSMAREWYLKGCKYEKLKGIADSSLCKMAKMKLNIGVKSKNN